MMYGTICQGPIACSKNTKLATTTKRLANVVLVVENYNRSPMIVGDSVDNKVDELRSSGFVAYVLALCTYHSLFSR